MLNLLNVSHICRIDDTKTFLLRNTKVDLKAFAQASFCVWYSYIFWQRAMLKFRREVLKDDLQVVR